MSEASGDMTVSVLLPGQPPRLSGLKQYANLVESSTLGRLWLGQSHQLESHLALAALLADTKIPVAIGTALAVLRSPYDAALHARSLALISGDEVSVGYGSADPGFVTRVVGSPFERPATYTAEYARLVRQLVSGIEVAGAIPELMMKASLPPALGDFKRPRIGVGVLRPGMAHKARDHVDFMVSWLTPRQYIRDTICPAMTREDGTRPALSTYVAVCLERPGRDPHVIAHYGIPHLTRAHYVDMLSKSGLEVDLDDPRYTAREIVDKGVFVVGDVRGIADQLVELRQGGVDEIVLNLTPVALVEGWDAAFEDLKLIVAEIDRRRFAPVRD